MCGSAAIRGLEVETSLLENLANVVVIVVSAVYGPHYVLGLLIIVIVIQRVHHLVVSLSLEISFNLWKWGYTTCLIGGINRRVSPEVHVASFLGLESFKSTLPVELFHDEVDAKRADAEAYPESGHQDSDENVDHVLGKDLNLLVNFLWCDNRAADFF